MKNQKFQIIGGGVAGLASALAVANTGNTVGISEKAEKFEAIGAGLQLGPNAVRALQQLGAWDAVAPIVNSPPELHIRCGLSGKTLHRTSLGKKFEQRFGMPYRAAHRGDLVNALLEAVRSKSSITVKSNSEITKLDQLQNIIAADGVWSKSREALFPNTKAIFTKEIYFRALIENPTNENICIWFYPGGHVVHYPVGHPAKLNLVAITQGQDAKTHYKNACDELQQILALPKTWSEWPAAYAPQIPKWNSGTTTLIGDAAHGTLPYLAQGAALALEDAAALQMQLSHHVTVDKAFASLSTIRVDRTQRLHKATLKAGHIYHMQGLMAKARNLTLQWAPNDIIAKRMDWIYRH
jgi:salicylate hydroxylase